jgi:hypothetical protein
MAAGKDLRSVASEVGIAEQTLKVMGGERSKRPSPDRLLEIAEATGAPIEWIVDGWDAVVAKSAVPAERQDAAETDALILRISRELSGVREDLDSSLRAQRQLAERVRALEAGGGGPRTGKPQAR